MLIPILQNNNCLFEQTKKLFEETTEFMDEVNELLRLKKFDVEHYHEEGFDLIQVCTNIINYFYKDVEKLSFLDYRFLSTNELKENILNTYSLLEKELNFFLCQEIYDSGDIIKYSKTIINCVLGLMYDDNAIFNRNHIIKLLDRGWKIEKMIRIEVL